MTERNFEGKLSRLVDLKRIRKLVGVPSSKEIEDMQRYFHPRVKSMCQKVITEGKDIILASYSQNRANFSIPGFCATVLKQVRDQLLGKAEENINEGKAGNFRYIFDFAFGFGLPANRVLAAEGELSGIGEETRLRILAHQSENYDTPITEEADTYLFMKKFDGEALRLLIKDKSGLELIDNLINKIKSNSSAEDMGGMSKEYVLTGAELARDLYRQLYEIVESPRANQQQK